MHTVNQFAFYFATAMLFAFGAIGAIGQEQFTYDDYARVLAQHVDDRGMVDYQALKANREPLDRFGRSLAGLERHEFRNWEPEEQIAFWINAYNALTLQVIIDNYPIKAGFFGSLRFPKNSIRQISGVWDEITFPVMGRQMTLEDIEHGTLRKDYDEPRIHLALVCAAMGCPKLRNEPYVGERLEEQLNDQGRHFVRQPDKFRIDRRRGRVHISPIFKWFGEDFVSRYAPSAGFRGHDREERAVLSFLSRYLEDADRRYLRTEDYDLKWLDYDWSLNEQPE